LIVEQDAVHLAALARTTETLGYRVRKCDRAEVARTVLRGEDVDVIVAGIHGSREEESIRLCESWRRDRPDIPVILAAEGLDVATVAASIRAGAVDCIPNPPGADALKQALARAVECREHARPIRRLATTEEAAAPLPNVIGSSPAMREVAHLVRRCACGRFGVLITGETGTGKELIARAIHELDPRTSGRFVAVNCAAFPASLIENELFGHAAGSFTGAHAESAGLFRAASGGTLLLDEIGELPVEQQAKLLRVLDSGLIRPVGSSVEQPVNARVLASTNRDLEEAARRGAFRPDLLFRLCVVEIHVPPLRERGDDVIEIARALVARAAREGSSPVRLTANAERTLRGYAWPGNVRELENCIAYALATDGATVDADSLPSRVRARESSTHLRSDALGLAEVERRHIDRVLQSTGGNRTEAARRLGIDRVTLYRKLRR
jgi:two-component system response regulator HydG